MKLFKKRINRPSSGRGTVALIAILLITSALLRLASGSGEALAQGIDKTVTTETVKSDSNPNEPAREMPQSGDDRAGMSKLLVALLDREAKVKEREAQLKIRTKALAVVGEEVARRITALEKAEIQLRGTLALADGAAEKDLARLTSVYENMKPKDSVALFEAMEPNFAAGFLGRMRPDAAASIFAGLKPATAYSISIILASRNANVPKS